MFDQPWSYSWKASFVEAGTRGLSGTDASDREIGAGTGK